MSSDNSKVFNVVAEQHEEMIQAANGKEGKGIPAGFKTNPLPLCGAGRRGRDGGFAECHQARASIYFINNYSRHPSLKRNYLLSDFHVESLTDSETIGR